MNTPERFVDVAAAAEFMSVSPRYVMDLARRGAIPGHPLAIGSKRKIWRFRLSEIAECLAGSGTSSAAPVGRRTSHSRQYSDVETGR